MKVSWVSKYVGLGQIRVCRIYEKDTNHEDNLSLCTAHGD